MTLHAAIEKLLREEGRPMSTKEIAAELNINKWYVKKDKSDLTPFQIHGRTKNYLNLFERDGTIVSLILKNKTHWKFSDSRIETLRVIISGLKASIKKLIEKYDELNWYDGFWLLEESEGVYGLALIACQNYINSSIYDKEETLKNRFDRYKLGDSIGNSNRKDIELVIQLSNYYKHKDDSKELHDKTVEVLKSFNLNLDKEVGVDESPIFMGMEILSKNQDLDEIVAIVERWRKKLWSEQI